MSSSLAVFLAVCFVACVLCGAFLLAHRAIMNRAETAPERLLIKALDRAAKAYADNKPGLAERYEAAADLFAQRVAQRKSGSGWPPRLSDDLLERSRAARRRLGD